MDCPSCKGFRTVEIDFEKTDKETYNIRAIKECSKCNYVATDIFEKITGVSVYGGK